VGVDQPKEVPTDKTEKAHSYYYRSPFTVTVHQPEMPRSLQLLEVVSDRESSNCKKATMRGSGLGKVDYSLHMQKVI
jgi:hypothetical protein